MRLISACLITFFLVFAVPDNPAFAHGQYHFPKATEGQLNEALQKTVPLRFLPSSPLHFLILIKESFTRFFKPSAAKKAQFDLILSGKRIKEAYLLLTKGDVKRSSKSLIRYSQRLDTMIKELDKARSQNQDVASFVPKIAEDLRLHEVFFYAIYSKWQSHNDNDQYNFDTNFAETIETFSQTVMVIDSIKPGLKNRFKTVTGDFGNQNKKESNKIPEVSPIPAATIPSVKPKRILY